MGLVAPAGAKVPALSLVMLVLLGLLRMTVARADIGLDYSPLFGIDTTYIANVGSTNSSLFTLDTRYGLGTAAKDSQGFTLDTRFSAGTGIGQSSGFTLDTLNASIADVLVTGRVTDSIGVGLGGAVVQASFFNRIQASATADAGGYYALPAIPAGMYQFRAAKYPYITGVRVGQSFSPGQSATENFSLALLPAPPLVEDVNRTPIAPAVPPAPTQLKVWNDSSFVVGLSLDPNKMTIVLTHGYCSSYTNWPKDMAGQLRDGPESISANANIVAWDWQYDAGKIFLLDLNRAYSRTPAQGEALGMALIQSLGANYTKRIHFLGHSLGSLVNSRAADYLQQYASTWPKAHFTLMDNAEAANAAGPIIEAGVLGLLGGPDAATTSLISSTANLLQSGWVSPVPKSYAWIDNYISFVGISESRAVNICLAQSPVFAASSYNPITFIENLHGYAHLWYGETIMTPANSLLGNRYSFERLGAQADLENSSPYPANSYFAQDNSSSELFLRQLNTAEEIANCQALLAKTVAKVTVTEVKAAVVGTVKKVGNVIVSIVQKTKSRLANLVNSLPSTSLLVGPIFASDAVNVASLRVELQNSSTGGPQAPFQQKGASENAGGSGSTNLPAYAWFTLAVPSNAVLMTFDFELQGDGSNDCLVFGINGTNLFTLETRFIPPDAEQNSGAINVRPWAGTNAEFFVGLSGGTSLDATIAVDGIRFYAEVAPSLQIVASGGNAVVTWPLGVSDYVLESTANLESPNSWTTVTNVPAVVDFQYTVTNSISSENKFYRLRK